MQYLVIKGSNRYNVQSLQKTEVVERWEPFDNPLPLRILNRTPLHKIKALNLRIYQLQIDKLRVIP